GGIVGGSMLYSSSQYQVSHTNSITNSYSAGLVSANTSPGGVIGYDNPARYSTSGANPRTNLYYDVSILLSYSAPYSKIPATTVGGQGLNKTSMFEDQMSTRGFSPSTWSFRPIDGNYAYYPQLQVFATSPNSSVVSDSLQSVITNPFLGDGTKLSPYIINTARDMVILSNSITDSFDAKDLYYLVAASVSNIDLTNVSYQPIGTSAHPFRGHFDGNHANFIVNLSGNDYLGLFGVTGQEAEIKNLSVTGEITGRNNLGAVAGYNQGLIENVYAKVNLNGMNNIGGLIGMNNGILKLFFSTGNITSTGSNIGGIVGYNSGEITEGFFGGKVQASSTVGALVGFSSNTNINEVYYNNTVIEFDDIIPGLIKPVHAVGNNFDFDHFKRSKEELTGTLVFNHVDLDSSNWILKATAGFYDFYPQLKGFASHANNAVKTNSEVSARIIRFAYGSGSKSNPYLIRDENDMKALSDITLNEHLSGIYFKVMDGVKVLDLTIPGLNFERIGHSNTRPFRGGFDGNDVEIIINSIKTTTDYLGLFGYLGEGAEVKNFTIRGEISGRNRVGGLAAEAYKSTITNVRNHATVRGVQYVGGLVGYISNTTILQSYNTGDVISTSRDIGGLVGWGEKTTIIEAFNSGNVTASQVVGGIIGYANNNMTIQYVYNRGDITSTVTSGNSWVGGIIGAQYTNSTLSESYSAGAVIARTNSYIGGLLGGVSGTTYEEKSYYDRSVMDAQLLPSGYRVPASAIINKLETDNLKKLYKNELIGLNPLTTTELNPDVWEFVETKDLEAHYPQLKVFSQHYNDYVKEDSKVSVQTFVFVGEGTSGSPYVITSKDDMDSLSALVQRGITFEGAYFKVKDDIDTIDLTYGKPYVSIGTPEYPFEGYFDGYGTNFILNLSNELDSQGLFGVVGEHGVIRNLSVSGSIHARNQVGSIVGTNFGLVEHVYATTTIDGTTNVGGLIGQNFGTLRYGYHIGEVIGDSVVGGIVGKNEDTILETYAASYIFGRTMIGGVVGYSDGDETLSYYNSAKVDVKTHDTLFKP
ncbi:MAG TPA: hypothetical protein VIK67_03365, partial [Acholeplasma sp.]